MGVYCERVSDTPFENLNWSVSAMKTNPVNRKLALAALLLAAAFLMSGCNLIVKDMAVDAQQVILSVNGEEIVKEQFTRYYENAYQQAQEDQAYYAQYYGFSPQAVDPDAVLENTLESIARHTLLMQKARELGLDAMTDEENAAIEEQAATQFESIRQQVKNVFFAGTALEGEELEAAIDKKAAELSLTKEAYRKSALENKLYEKLHDYAGRDIEVSEEQIQSAFDEKVAQAKADYAENLAAYGTALRTGQTVYYAPAGYRTVRQILVQLPQAEQDAIRALESELTPLQTALNQAQAGLTRYEDALKNESASPEDSAFADEQHAALGEGAAARVKELLALESLTPEQSAELDAFKAALPVYRQLEEAKALLAAKQEELDTKREAAFSGIQARTDEVYQLATAEGADFDALIAQYNDDVNQPEQGYLLCQDTTDYVPAFTQAALALESVGDISQPTRTNYGNHILRYQSDVQEGPVELGGVRETLEHELFHARQDEVYTQLQEAWMAEAVIEKYPERFKD